MPMLTIDFLINLIRFLARLCILKKYNINIQRNSNLRKSNNYFWKIKYKQKTYKKSVFYRFF